jgi:hypothetical protein
MSDPKVGASGSWWATLPGILTGVAALITAIGGLITVLLPLFRSNTDIAPRLQPGSTTPKTQRETVVIPPSGTPIRVDNVWVDIAEVRRFVDQGKPSLELVYRVSTRTSFARHDPSRFVRLVAGNATSEPYWAPPPVDVPPQGLQHIRVLFVAPEPGSAVFQFGVEQIVNIKSSK